MKWAFQSIATNRFLTVADQEPDCPLYASAVSVGEKETFDVQLLSDNSSLCVIQAFNGNYLGYNPLGVIIDACGDRDEAIQFAQLYTQAGPMSLVDAQVETVAALVVVDTNSTPANLIITVPLETANWPNQFALFKVISVSQ